VAVGTAEIVDLGRDAIFGTVVTCFGAGLQTDGYIFLRSRGLEAVLLRAVVVHARYASTWWHKSITGLKPNWRPNRHIVPDRLRYWKVK